MKSPSDSQTSSPLHHSKNSSPIHHRSRPDSVSEENEQEREHTKNEIVQQFNSNNAKIVAFFIICGFVLYHTILRLTHGKLTIRVCSYGGIHRISLL